MLIVSRQTIYNWIKKYNNYFIDNKYLDTIIRHSHIKLLDNEIIEFIKGTTYTLEELSKKFLISKTTVSRILKRNNYSYKKIYNKTIPFESYNLNDIRKNYASNISNNFLNYISLDECSFNISDYKRYRYSEKGIKFIRSYNINLIITELRL